MDDPHLTTDQFLEKVLSPLYLNVAGAELDRLREQMIRALHRAAEHTSEDVVFVVGDQTTRTIQVVPESILIRAINEPTFVETMKDAEVDEITHEITTVYRAIQYCDSESDQFALDFSILLSMIYFLACRQPLSEEEGVKVVMFLIHRKLNGKEAILFTMLRSGCA